MSNDVQNVPSRSTYHDAPTAPAADDVVVSRIRAIGEEFEAYGCRLMREHNLQPRCRRRYVVTTDSDHEQPIYPNVAPGFGPSGRNQLWVADITYAPIIGASSTLR